MSGGIEREPPELEAFRRHQARVEARAEPRSSRIAILETADGLGIYNPSRRSWPLVAFLVVWLAGWAAGESFALSQIVGAPLPVVAFLAIWGSLWTLAGVGVTTVVLWLLGGAEVLFLTDGFLVREIRFFGLVRRKVVPLDAITDIDVAANVRSASPTRLGKVHFNAAGRPMSFGIGFDRDEAKSALEAIKNYLSRKTPSARESAQSPR